MDGLLHRQGIFLYNLILVLSVKTILMTFRGPSTRGS